MKHSKIVVFLSLLLVAVMAFSSCSGSAVIPEGDEQLNAPKEDIIIDLLDESTPADAESALRNAIAANKTEIANAVAKWHDYVGFKQNSLVADETAIGKDLMNNYTRVTFDISSRPLIIARAEQDVWNEELGEYELSHKRVLVYNLYKENFEEPVFDSGDYKDYEQTPEANYTTYSISTNSYIAGFKVLKTERIAKYEPSQENPEVQVFKEYEVKYSTSFYTTEAIVPTVEESMDWSSSGYVGDEYVGYYYFNVTIGDKVYAINSEGEILKVFDKGLEYVIPANADYEKNGLRYYFEDEYVYVLDENFAPLSSYAFLADYNMRWEMLPNGNLFFQYLKALDDDAESFDMEIDGVKFDIIQHLYNVKTGAVSELELGYVVADEIYDSESTEFTVKNEDNFIVEAVKYTKGSVYSEDVEPAVLVLKGDFELVAELPEIIENQTGMPKIVALNKLVVTTKFAGAGRNYNVLVSTDGSYELLPYGVSFGKTSFNYDGETCIYSTSDNHEFSTPFENYSVVRTFNGTTTLIKTENSGYAYLYYYSESRGEYVKERFYRADYERIVTTVDSLILFEIDEGEYTWYDAAGNSVVNTESTNYYRVGDGILIHVYHAASDYPNRYYFVK